MERHRPSLVAFVTLLFALATAPAVAQTTYATITGTVSDTSGAVVAGATVVATHTQTSFATMTATNAEGVYTVPQLRHGSYTLVINAPGLREFRVADILLVIRDRRRIDATLELGSLETAVEVIVATPRSSWRHRA